MRAKPQTHRTAARKKVLLVDDHPILREGLVHSINRQPDLTVCGEAESAEQALRAVGQLKPDLVLVDIGLPGKSGLELVKDLHELKPELPVLVLSMHDEGLYAERVLRAGARGYLMKQERPELILTAIRTVIAGRSYVSEKMTARIVEALSGRRSQDNAMATTPLTDREFEILQLVGRGKSSHEIAAKLRLSVRTVDTHRTNLKQKLKLKSALQLTHYAVRLVEGSEPARA